MQRVMVPMTAADGQPTGAGWFDLDKATVYSEATEWDGHNQVSVHESGRFASFRHQQLIRTSGGRWVLNRWARIDSEPETWEYITEDQAQQWLMINGDEDAIAQWWPETEEERGPGRPVEVGGKPVNIRLGDLQTEVDQLAAANGVSRAEMARRLIQRALES